ncbi:hypothetical protein [Nocardiopsis sp. CNT312]|uniref:hypothetical protein n=1 Tax=Nocardiopsis sp. CNT312 TaxID=1137268 RepID=UPI0004B6525C|nr:hypothetical protein [Nocardiopsis sp. CNT312]
MTDDAFEDVGNQVMIDLALSLAAIVLPLAMLATCDSDGGGYRGGGASFDA